MTSTRADFHSIVPLVRPFKVSCNPFNSVLAEPISLSSSCAFCASVFKSSSAWFILSSLASCCNPVHGEEIVGFITKGYGVKIHAKNCPNIDLNSERIIEAVWEGDVDNRYTAKLKVYIEDIGDILLNIITTATKSDIVIESINLINRNKELFYDISCKVKNIESLHNFIDEVKLIKSVKSVERMFI